MKYTLALVGLILSCSAFAWPNRPPPRPGPAWTCEAAGLDRWNRWVGVYGQPSIFRPEAERSAFDECRWERLWRCRVTRCYFGVGLIESEQEGN